MVEYKHKKRGITSKRKESVTKRIPLKAGLPSP